MSLGQTQLSISSGSKVLEITTPGVHGLFLDNLFKYQM